MSAPDRQPRVEEVRLAQQEHPVADRRVRVDDVRRACVQLALEQRHAAGERVDRLFGPPHAPQRDASRDAGDAARRSLAVLRHRRGARHRPGSSDGVEPAELAGGFLPVAAARRARQALQRGAQRAEVDGRALGEELADVGVDRARPAPPVARAAGDERVLLGHVAAAGARHHVLARQIAPPQLAAAPHARRAVALDQILHLQGHATQYHYLL